MDLECKASNLLGQPIRVNGNLYSSWKNRTLVNVSDEDAAKLLAGNEWSGGEKKPAEKAVRFAPVAKAVKPAEEKPRSFRRRKSVDEE